MQERTIIDEGREKIFRQFVKENTNKKLTERLERFHRAAIRDPKTQSITQKRIMRNELCPCGSGRKFKKCCIVKVNKGEEIIGEQAIDGSDDRDN